VTSSPSAAASKILALIEDEEGNYQTSLNDIYHEMGDKAFKGLRRALPLTRQKLDWDKVGCTKMRTIKVLIDTSQVLGYKLGAELSSSKGVFGNS
jgi:capping protein (actin filament) muscle Z-line, alpha